MLFKTISYKNTRSAILASFHLRERTSLKFSYSRIAFFSYYRNISYDFYLIKFMNKLLAVFRTLMRIAGYEFSLTFLF